MTPDLQDLARRLFKAAVTIGTNNNPRPLPQLVTILGGIWAPDCETYGRVADIVGVAP